MRYFLIGVLLGILAFSMFGCTIHFKGENLEMDMERQRVFRFDGVTFTDWAKSDIGGPVFTYKIESIDWFRSKFANNLYRQTVLAAARK